LPKAGLRATPRQPTYRIPEGSELGAMLPLSRETQRLPALKEALAIYRLVFGQPRQEDLLELLKRQSDIGSLDLTALAWPHCWCHVGVRR
jgi:hypothetical protein